MTVEANKPMTGERMQVSSNQLETEQSGARVVGRVGTILIMVYLILFSIFLLYSLVQLWPSSPQADGASTVSSVTFLFWTLSISGEVHLLLIVVLAGALGSMVHALRSLYWYIGNRQLVMSWLAMYILLPFVGITLAIIFYLVIRGGFFSPQATVQETSPFGFAALSGLVGMFTEQAVLKLKDVAQTMLTKAQPGVDAKPQE